MYLYFPVFKYCVFPRLKEKKEEAEIFQPVCFSFANVLFAWVCASYFYLCGLMCGRKCI